MFYKVFKILVNLKLSETHINIQNTTVCTVRVIVNIGSVNVFTARLCFHGGHFVKVPQNLQLIKKNYYYFSISQRGYAHWPSDRPTGRQYCNS